MHKVYSHPSEAMVHLVKAELENHGIETVVRGEHAAAVMGGGAGFDAWVELWVVDEQRISEAEEIVQAVMDEEATDVSGQSWTCTRCGTVVEPQFTSCWNCGADRVETV